MFVPAAFGNSWKVILETLIEREGPSWYTDVQGSPRRLPNLRTPWRSHDSSSTRHLDHPIESIHTILRFLDTLPVSSCHPFLVSAFRCLCSAARLVTCHPYFHSFRRNVTTFLHFVQLCLLGCYWLTRFFCRPIFPIISRWDNNTLFRLHRVPRWLTRLAL